MKWVGRGQRESEGSRESSDLTVSVICAYAPTAKAHSRVKSRFLSDLQDTLDKVLQNDVPVVLGDFNARVGVLKHGEEGWQGVLVKNGLDERNKAGEAFIHFCGLNQLTVMNSWFQKKCINFGMHPATKLFLMIDLVVMRAKQKVCCRNVRVMREANCWTDHKLVRAKLRVALPHSQ